MPDSSATSAGRRRLNWLVACVAAAIVVGVAAWAQLGARRAPAVEGFEVVAVYPHDPGAFTQGLAIEAGQLYEGTGQYGASAVRRVDLASGRPEKQRALNPRYFGEGIAILGGLLYQLTWQNGVAVVYDLESFEVRRTMPYDGEGWGLTHDGRELIMSDGSATIRFRNPETFAVTREIEVLDHGVPVTKLNELEFIDGEIWSNIWYDDRIVRISPADGSVLGYIDLKGLYPQNVRSSEAVLNGIAYDKAAERLFVTGKNWPQLYEIKVARR
jgi:glutamine cyclotransferase